MRRVLAQHRTNISSIRTVTSPRCCQALDDSRSHTRRSDSYALIWNPTGPQGEAHLLPVQLALQHRDLVAQDQDLGVLVPIAHGKETQHRERVSPQSSRPVATAQSHIMPRRPPRRGRSRPVQATGARTWDWRTSCTSPARMQFSAHTTLPIPQPKTPAHSTKPSFRAGHDPRAAPGGELHDEARASHQGSGVLMPWLTAPPPGRRA